MHVSQKSQTWANMAEAPRQSFEKYMISGMIQKYSSTFPYGWEQRPESHHIISSLHLYFALRRAIAGLVIGTYA